MRFPPFESQSETAKHIHKRTPHARIKTNTGMNGYYCTVLYTALQRFTNTHGRVNYLCSITDLHKTEKVPLRNIENSKIPASKFWNHADMRFCVFTQLCVS